MLAFPMLQALSAILIPLAIFMMLWVRLPLLLGLLGLVPALTSAVVVAAETMALRELRRTYHLNVRTFDYVRFVLTTIPFQLVLVLAAARATWREMIGERGWEKTAHAGAHLQPTAFTASEV